jgi:hypothetical protein
MQPHILAQRLYESLSEHSILLIKVDRPTSIDGPDRVSLRNNLFLDKSPDSPVHRAGVYIIGSNTEVLRIGEAGGGDASMGGRAFKRLVRVVTWMKPELSILSQYFRPNFGVWESRQLWHFTFRLKIVCRA